MESDISSHQNNVTGFTDSDTLQFILNHANISLEDVADAMKKSKLNEVLKKHPYAIA